jgi:hypothetical protein
MSPAANPTPTPMVSLNDDDVSIEILTDAAPTTTTEKLADDSWQANGQNKQNFQKN